MHRAGIAFLLLALLLTGCSQSVDILWDSTKLDPQCATFPPAAGAERALAEQEEAVRAIENVHPGYIWVDLDTVTCPGRAQVVISYDTEANRARIERLIGGDTLFGIPYRMVNR